ncbi:AAA family ATPase [Actinomadura macrotermitis]|uniref:AAA family ATPase n=1 Tax=Actinomadura macrotermitis TaxID=2585200 RepID=UPI001F4038E3|nr:MoxR family ATPase [Actinomadura macrotermitis]
MQKFDELGSNIERVIRGKRRQIDLALICMVSEGHLLLQDVPGVGKTTLAKAIALSLGLKSSRIQFTPDLLPSDITGVSIYEQTKNEFKFVPGPVFANVVIADEINRGSPKTQSALLEVMEERQVSVDGKPRALQPPFMVVATQNPVDMDGTYALPEAQLDRFLMRLSMDYPDYESEIALLSRPPQRAGAALRISMVATRADMERMTAHTDRVQVARVLVEYVASIITATRRHHDVSLGASPRAGLAILRAVRTQAAAEGRSFAVPQDVKNTVLPVLTHRLLLTSEAELGQRSAEGVLTEIMDSVEVPKALLADH